jgi:repressor LexA
MELGLTQEELAEKLGTTRVTVARYEAGMRRIPPAVERLIKELARSNTIPMAGIVAAGKPIEAVEQSEFIEIPQAMIRGKENFALHVTGESMRDDGILAGDIVVLRKQPVARDGDTVIALVNGQATLKKFYRKGRSIELHPVNSAMQPIVVRPNDEFQIQGTVVGLMRYYK